MTQATELVEVTLKPCPFCGGKASLQVEVDIETLRLNLHHARLLPATTFGPGTTGEEAERIVIRQFLAALGVSPQPSHR